MAGRLTLQIFAGRHAVLQQAHQQVPLAHREPGQAVDPGRRRGEQFRAVDGTSCMLVVPG